MIIQSIVTSKSESVSKLLHLFKKWVPSFKDVHKIYVIEHAQI